MQTVYVLGADKKLQPVPVATGITDGTYTEVRSRELAEGQELVVGIVSKNGQQQMSAPPGLGGTNRRSGGGRRF